MSIIVFTHPIFVKHEMGVGHPESPQRIKAIQQALEKAPYHQQLIWQEPPQATKAQLARVHHEDYIEKLFKVAPQTGYLSLDPDTVMNPYSLTAALHAAGSVVAAVEAVFHGETQKAFCLVRPPGHHAEPDRAMGFCFFNNIAVGVAHALAQNYCQRVAIIDFDVHHGNGTETMMLQEPGVCFWSSFEHPFYPGTQLNGKPEHIHLCPLSAGTTGELFRGKIDQELIPLLEAFKPECLFISAGFDAHQLDPLADLKLQTSDYAYVTEKLREIADKYANGRMISTLEGGYHLTAIADSVVAHINSLIE
ncbi:histone deacetylase family protein [Candidatus Berkiella aquae]|uniref:Histone deacetylase family protein n=1 Tax=Candidatus Berkiella aquae TaxID=295108 RepID=A0A0Q9YYS3_9GAMM|nr:histone deacetylase family protein [Candidatus Berkiella aquae]MCS5710397.1 histone deacetylase family protein [Candidatus Berkiella aquae]